MSPEETVSIGRIIRQLGGQSWRAQPLEGAHSNRVWRVESDAALSAQGLVLKRVMHRHWRNPLFANSIGRERRAMRCLPMAPPLLAHCGDWLAMPYYPPRAVGLDQVSATLAAVHQTLTRQRARRGVDWVAQARALLQRCPESAARRQLESMAPAAYSPRLAALTHRDPHPLNWVGGEQALLIDWQSAAIGDPLEDLACWASPLMRMAYAAPVLPSAQPLLEAYAAWLPIRGQWERAQAAFEYRLACYCLWRQGRYREGLAQYLRAA